MEVVRTPDERFENLPGYPFTPHYLDVEKGLRMHYVDEGPRDGAVVLLLHGEPTWSYLYRKMIPLFADAGCRVVVPDLIGFGKSDKPTSQKDYSYARHVGWVKTLLKTLELKDMTLFCQDWGSLIGLRIVGEEPDWFNRVAVGNGFLPAGQQRAPLAFYIWRTYARFSPSFPIGKIVVGGCNTRLSRAERAAYDAPFPSEQYKAGARIFPALVPVSSRDPAIPANQAAWAALGKFNKPFLTLFGKDDPILGTGDVPLQKHIPGAKGQPHESFPGNHFVQEDQGPHIAEVMIRWMGKSKSTT